MKEDHAKMMKEAMGMMKKGLRHDGVVHGRNRR